MNAFDAQKQVQTGYIQLTRAGGKTFRLIILNGQVQALTVNDLPLDIADDRGPSHEDLNDDRWEIFHACRLAGNQDLPIWFTGLRKRSQFAYGRSESH